MSDDDQIIVTIAVGDGWMDMAVIAAWVSLYRWQRWVDADFPGAT